MVCVTFKVQLRVKKNPNNFIAGVGEEDKTRVIGKIVFRSAGCPGLL